MKEIIIIFTSNKANIQKTFRNNGSGRSKPVKYSP